MVNKSAEVIQIISLRIRKGDVLKLFNLSETLFVIRIRASE
jgi:hypothetical protein